MPKIQIEIKEKIATNKTPEIEIVSQNDDYEIEFLFDSEWDNYNIKTVRFYYNFSHIDVLIQGNICAVPPLEETNLLRVGVFTDDIKTSTVAEIKCKFSIKKYGGNVKQPSKDIYNQIIELLNRYVSEGDDLSIEEKTLVEKIVKEYYDNYKLDVQIDGVSIVKNGIANIPYATQNVAGLAIARVDQGIYIGANGYFSIAPASENAIKSKQHKFQPIAPFTLDFAVKEGVVNNSLVLTEEEITKALAWLGASKKKYRHIIRMSTEYYHYITDTTYDAIVFAIESSRNTPYSLESDLEELASELQKYGTNSFMYPSALHAIMYDTLAFNVPMQVFIYAYEYENNKIYFVVGGGDDFTEITALTDEVFEI